MTRPIRRAAIVGLSWIASDPAGPAVAPGLSMGAIHSHAAAYACQPDVDVVAVCDIAPSAREAFVDRWSPTWPGVTAHATHRDLLAAHDIDVVSIVTPDDRHSEVFLDAVDAGVKAIFCEKPLSTSLADADRMIAAARAAGVTTSVNYTRRWLPEFALARKLASDGSIGVPALITARFGGSRAMLFRNTTHYLDLMVSLAGAEPVWVSSELDPGFEGYGAAYGGDGGHDPDTEPGSTSVIGFANGVRGFVSDSKRTLKEPVVEVVGSEGSVSVRDGVLTLSTPAGLGHSRQVVAARPALSGMSAAVRELIDSVETGAPVTCPAEEARHAIALAAGVLNSAAGDGRRIMLADVT